MNGLMTQLTRIKPGKDVEEAHMRNRKLISEWCYEKGRADNVIELVEQNGKTYVVVNDFGKLRALFGDLLREMELYCWDQRGSRDTPRKEHDHAMDEMRYFAMDVAAEEQGGFAATCVERRAL